MLNKDVFIKGLGYLKACYINWQFDLTNKDCLEIWYKKFSNLNDNQYRIMVESYTDNNKFPPNSPADLLEELRGVYASCEMKPEEAWNYVIDLMSKHSFHYHPELIYKALEDKPILKRTVEQLEGQLNGLKSSDVANVSKEFKNVYKSNLGDYTSQKVETLLTIGNNKQKLLN